MVYVEWLALDGATSLANGGNVVSYCSDSRGDGKMEKFTAVFEQDGNWWIGWVEELPGANTQGRTLDEARENLKEAVRLVIDANRELAHRETEGKRRLWELLDEQIAQAEERVWEQDPTIQAEIREARAAYQTGDYVTIDEYAATPTESWHSAKPLARVSSERN